jgi:aminoglycoside phosphotransferase (APT) family kinase protein
VRRDDDNEPSLRRVLDALGVQDGAFLGSGGEARVYAIDAERILRVLHEGGNRGQIERNRELLEELDSSTLPFTLPEILEIGDVGGRTYAVERRAAGHSVAQELGSVDPHKRASLIEAHLEAAHLLGELRLGPRPYFGDLVAPDPVRSETWHGYLDAVAERSIASSGLRLPQGAVRRLSDDLPDTDHRSFVDIDIFAGNMLTDRDRITAVIDIGPACVAGDKRFNAISAAVYLRAPEITPTSQPGDASVVEAWLKSEALEDLYSPVRRWLAAYWSFATDDPPLHDWCRSVLVLGR